jgi:hypothetical protein
VAAPPVHVIVDSRGWFDRNAAAIQAVLVVFTGAYVWLTYRLSRTDRDAIAVAQEANRISREQQLNRETPVVMIYRAPVMILVGEFSHTPVEDIPETISLSEKVRLYASFEVHIYGATVPTVIERGTTSKGGFIRDTTALEPEGRPRAGGMVPDTALAWTYETTVKELINSVGSTIDFEVTTYAFRGGAKDTHTFQYSLEPWAKELPVGRPPVHRIPKFVPVGDDPTWSQTRDYGLPRPPTRKNHWWSKTSQPDQATVVTS